MKNELIEMLKQDLRNEVLHMNFYLLNSTTVTGLHREEISEFLFEQAQDEMNHVRDFANMIQYLGGTPNINDPELVSTFHNPDDILNVASSLEKVVAENYNQRLIDTDSKENADVTAVHLFYEDQLQDSWTASREIERMMSQCQQNKNTNM